MLGDIFFIILILWGSFFTLNLLLAVLEGNFTKGKEDDKVKMAWKLLVVLADWVLIVCCSMSPPPPGWR